MIFFLNKPNQNNHLHFFHEIDKKKIHFFLIFDHKNYTFSKNQSNFNTTLYIF